MSDKQILDKAISEDSFELYLKWLGLIREELTDIEINAHNMDFRGLTFRDRNPKALPSEYLAYKLQLLMEFASKSEIKLEDIHIHIPTN